MESNQKEETDISGADRGVWLVKVPKYMDSEWKKAETNSELGKLKIIK